MIAPPTTSPSACSSGPSSTDNPAAAKNVFGHELTVAALQLHRTLMRELGLYEPEGFVFCTRNKTPMSMANLRQDFKSLCARAGIPGDWTTYELRHSFVSLIDRFELRATSQIPLADCGDVRLPGRFEMPPSAWLLPAPGFAQSQSGGGDVGVEPLDAEGGAAGVAVLVGAGPGEQMTS